MIGFALFSSAQGWPETIENTYKHAAVPAKPGVVEYKFTAIAPGRYAAVILHDENKNKKLDKKASGRPKEGWAMSNNPKASLKTPKFEAAATNIACGDHIELTLRYPTKEDPKASDSH